MLKWLKAFPERVARFVVAVRGWFLEAMKVANVVVRVLKTLHIVALASIFRASRKIAMMFPPNILIICGHYLDGVAAYVCAAVGGFIAASYRVIHGVPAQVLGRSLIWLRCIHGDHSCLDDAQKVLPPRSWCR
jgi:hypothetical protein